MRGGVNQWVRMREDKLRSLKKSLLHSYQKAVVQKYNVKKETLAKVIEQLKLRGVSEEEINNIVGAMA